MVVHTGDLVDTPTHTSEWEVANTAMMTLYNNGVPYMDVEEEEIRRRALAEEKVAQHVAGRQVVKVIIVPHKLVNIVVK